MEVSVRIVSIDWHMIKGGAGQGSSRQPEIRVYGPTAFGQTVCCHIRGFFPYLLIDVDELDFRPDEFETFTTLFNEALSSGQNGVRSYIQSLEIVDRRPVYGYHRTLHKMLRINLFDPSAVKPAALLLRSGALCNGYRFAVLHAHLPYTLQFFIEYRLFGMNWMHVSPGGYRFRGPLPTRADYNQSPVVDELWTMESTPCELVSNTSRESNCCLEVDVVASFIRNVYDPIPDGLAVPSLADVWRDLGMTTQAICPLSLDARHEYEYSDIEMAYRKRLDALVSSSGQSSQRLSQPVTFSYDSGLALQVCTQQSDEMDDLAADLNENRFGTSEAVVDDQSGDEESDEDDAAEAEPEPAESDDKLMILNQVMNESDDDDDQDVAPPSLSQNSSYSTERLTQSQATPAPSSQPYDDEFLSVLGKQRERKTPAPTLAQEPYFSDPEHRIKELVYIRKDGRRINPDRLFLEKSLSADSNDHRSIGGCLIRPFKDPPTISNLLSAKIPSGVRLKAEAGHIDSNGRVVMGRIGNGDISITQTQTVEEIRSPSCSDGGSSSTPSSQTSSSPFGHHRQHLRVAEIESLHQTRDDFEPDPKTDAVMAVVIGVEIDGQAELTRVLVNSAALTVPNRFNFGYDTNKIAIILFDSELALLKGVVHQMLQIDPDILVAYEMQKQSVGYLSERAAALGIPNFFELISRVIPKPETSKASAFHDAWGERKASGLHVPGRIVLNLWRILRSELKLPSYSLHVVALHLIGVRVPNHSWTSLNRMVRSGLRGVRRALDDRLGRAKMTLSLLSNQNLIQRTSELARLFGIDFFSVLTRGSQYRVESVMVRQGVYEGFAFYSASPEQVAHQPAMECIPLVMEPRSAMYSDPVIVLV